MIFRLFNSSFVPYSILVGLGLFYFHLYCLVDKQSYDHKAYEVTVNVLSEKMQESIMGFEQNILERRVGKYGYKVNNLETYLSISKFYGLLLQEQSDISYEKLLSVATYLDDDFKRLHTSEELVGVDRIDLDILYRKLMYKYISFSSGCGISYPYVIRSKYNREKEVYISNIVSPMHIRRLTLLYNGQEYRLNGNTLELQFEKKDVDRGYADVIVRDRITKEDKPHRIEISSYAFKV